MRIIVFSNENPNNKIFSVMTIPTKYIHQWREEMYRRFKTGSELPKFDVDECFDIENPRMSLEHFNEMTKFLFEN